MSASPQPTVGLLINRIARFSQRWSDSHLSALGIAAAAVPVLTLLEARAPLRQKELAKRIGIEQPTMAQLLNRMERDGLIARIADPEDGRSAHVIPTEQARRVLPQARRVLQQGNALATHGFSEEEVAALVQMLQRYLENLEAALPSRLNG